MSVPTGLSFVFILDTEEDVQKLQHSMNSVFGTCQPQGLEITPDEIVHYRDGRGHVLSVKKTQVYQPQGMSPR